MPSPRALRAWSWVHKWSSLVCTVFMLLLCLTGLPLIFHHEIGHLLGTEIEAPEMAADAPRISLDRVLEIAIAEHPEKGGMYVSQEEDDDRVWYVTLSDTPLSDSGLKQVAVDARTGEALGQPPLDSGFMHLMFSLHVDLFAGLPGTLFLGFMGLLLLVALVSGVVLYAPFMRKLGFGEVRRDRSSRVRWLDLHNLLGIVTLTWLFVVGATGVINTWADLLVRYWQTDQMAEMVAPYRGQPPLDRDRLGSLQAAVSAAVALEPSMKVGFVAFPGTLFTSPHHYGVFMRGTDPLNSRLFKPVLVDAVTGQVTDSRELPWYLTGLLISQPLHFGDYGGRPMQILWAVLDILTIIVLGSGLYLWLRRGVTGSADAVELPRALTGREAPNLNREATHP
ncbi:MAG: PepSY domain-containing protein [Hydrogenophaga sp.]|uniref:PepSY-associated TM helix domain-containing protein n=1 Tax=Hydrogenophaga sp. TaxID=1904254 RepID=UPI0016A14995|nr:PepSY domain-containing protein [Hydrogenophaga sp.]NIM42934.1 PepSY domain-containing protein [Hydrogenophaga sp.]NIN27864.1 PepSY domain-containing protein [Hydrogenophaga sp.]NIN29545.1 PepSY domain-containing protein [Hydrogenophaga sp.]NIN57137.1 PepSY domain-containing protein [Hydrogenophaga sp.]NIO53548.1 PepSY domain-containing protein [Hydrogenophaga sp.]